MRRNATSGHARQHPEAIPTRMNGHANHPVRYRNVSHSESPRNHFDSTRIQHRDRFILGEWVVVPDIHLAFPSVSKTMVKPAALLR